MIDNTNKSQRKLEKDTEDDALWKYATQDVTPLAGKTHTSEKKAAPSRKKSKDRKRENIQEKTNTLAPASPDASSLSSNDHQTDKRTAQRLKRGQIPIDARLDLHGMSQSEAYSNLHSFILSCVHQKHKCVLIITGKGRPRHGNTPLHEQKQGILKTRTPQWLNEKQLKEHILRIEPAQPRDGGTGALYVLLRRKKD